MLFFGCYLLVSRHAERPGATYIGFTVNPVRRLRQHNGAVVGGASRTARRRPWDMVLVVHGFPNKFAALQFEWAWQNPHKSRHFSRAKCTSTTGRPWARHHAHQSLAAKLFALSQMLSLPPYRRWPLHVAFMSAQQRTAFAATPLGARVPTTLVSGPDALPFAFTSIDEDDVIHDDDDERSILADVTPMRPAAAAAADGGRRRAGICAVCSSALIGATPSCAHCDAKSHLACLARHMLGDEVDHQLIPIKGPCPACRRELSWGDVVMRLKMDKAREPTAAVHDEPLSPPQTQRATQEAVSLFNVGSDGSDGGPEVLSEEMLDNFTPFAERVRRMRSD